MNKKPNVHRFSWVRLKLYEDENNLIRNWIDEDLLYKEVSIKYRPQLYISLYVGNVSFCVDIEPL